MAAAERGHADVVRLLLEAKSKVNSRTDQGYTALLFAVIGGHSQVVDALLTAKVDLDAAASSYGGGRNPLMAALGNGNLPVARSLLNAGASVHARTNYGATPLRFAVWGDSPGHVEMVRALLARGADVDAGYAYQASSLGEARRRMESMGLAGSITADGPILGLRSAEGTALGDAAARGYAAVVQVLIEAGADVDARQIGWRTPLMMAAMKGSVESVRLLLDAGADPSLTDVEDMSAVMHAQRRGHAAVVELLRPAGGVRAARQ